MITTMNACSIKNSSQLDELYLLLFDIQIVLNLKMTSHHGLIQDQVTLYKALQITTESRRRVSMIQRLMVSPPVESAPPPLVPDIYASMPPLEKP